jgi:hypothetical protein
LCFSENKLSRKKISRFLQHLATVKSQISQSQILKFKTMNDVLSAAIIFFGMYHIFRLLFNFLLRRKIIKAGHFDKAGILEPSKLDLIGEEETVNRYPSLKWGLVAFCAGLGLIIIELIRQGNGMEDWDNPLMPVGIELVSIAIGFLSYFLIINRKKSKRD